MTRKILESDWKLLRQFHKVALERFCQGVLAEIEGITADQGKDFHQRYLDIFQVVQHRNKAIADTFEHSRRSVALFQLTSMRSRGLLTEEEYLQFSAETREVVELFLGGRKGPVGQST